MLFLPNTSSTIIRILSYLLSHRSRHVNFMSTKDRLVPDMRAAATRPTVPIILHGVALCEQGGTMWLHDRNRPGGRVLALPNIVIDCSTMLRNCSNPYPGSCWWGIVVGSNAACP